MGEGLARLQRYFGFRGDSSKNTPPPPLSRAPGPRQQPSTSLSPPSSPRRPPGPSQSASAQGSGPAHPLQKPLPPDCGDHTSWAGRGGPGLWGGGYLEPFEARPRARSAPSVRTARRPRQGDDQAAPSRRQQEALGGHGPGIPVLETLEPRPSARSRPTVAMASEVVCGLIFRLLLPICLAVGECSPLAQVTWEGAGGA